MKLSQRPNVVLVITDDQGYGDLGCTGNDSIRTPNIDEFYHESVRMSNFHVGPTCAPSRSGLLTGHYANSTGVWHTIGGRSLLRENEWTLADALQENGYRTGIFGKWHLGDEYPYSPQFRGFERTVVHGGGGISQTPDHWGNDYFDDTYLVDGEKKRFDGYCTDVWFSEALEFIGKNRNRPFFAYIATNAPHSPLNVEEKYAELYRELVPERRARFYGMIENIDENFGRLMRELDRWGLAETTILIFMTDNGTAGGAELDDRGFVTSGYNAGMRGKKGSQYEGGHRVPFFMRWPGGNLQGGRDVEELTANVDLMPTILDLCGVKVPEDRGFHGSSIRSLLFDLDQKWKERVLVTDSQRLAHPKKWRQSAVMSERWRLIDGCELYDIKADPGQRRDLAGRHPEVVKDLREEYERWWAIVSRQFDEDIPFVLGSGEREELILTCHDWRNEEASSPWNQKLIREGMEEIGYWELRVESGGTYVFELRRWPREVDRPIISGIEGSDIDWKEECTLVPEFYSGGRALPFTRAGISLAGRTRTRDIDEGDHCIRFEVDLNEGDYHLKTWFTDEKELTVGAYYVYIHQAST